MAKTSWADGSTHTQPGFKNTGAPFNFAYSTSSKSYTAAAGGFPLGDLTGSRQKKQHGCLQELRKKKIPLYL